MEGYALKLGYQNTHTCSLLLVEISLLYSDTIAFVDDSLDPQFGVHKVVKRLKGVSSRYLRKEFPQLRKRLPTLWTNSYFVSTVGGAPLARIKEYIANQKRSR